jgi:hypothetical protein
MLVLVRLHLRLFSTGNGRKTDPVDAANSARTTRPGRHLARAPLPALQTAPLDLAQVSHREVAPGRTIV